jgi:tRNA G46 methylase TrmB
MRSDNKTSARHEDLLTRVGVGRPVKEEKFWRRLENRFGKPARNVIERINQRANGISDRDFWRRKNENLDLSLSLSGQFMGDFYRSYLPWLSTVTENFEITRILDVGCDNGVLACSYATSFPNAEVIGIDRSSEGIACANELAGRLEIGNVKFRKLDALELATDLAGENFDLITATMTYHSVSEIPGMPSGYSLFEQELPDTTDWQVALRGITPLVRMGGKFISVERLTSSAGTLWWARALTGAGLRIDWPSSEVLCYPRFGEECRLPAFVCDRQQPSVDHLASDALAFQARPDLIKIAKTPFEGDVAEALFEGVGDRTLTWGLEIASAEGVVERFEVWEARTLILAYTYSNMRGRRLVIGPCHKQQECIEQAKHFWESKPHTRLRHYASIAERDLP